MTQYECGAGNTDLKIGLLTSQRPESWQQTEIANVTTKYLQPTSIDSYK